ncbi:MAG: hypothetical protein ACC645_15735 [Pirellulales bacterium]
MDDLAVQQYVRLAGGTLAAAVAVATLMVVAGRLRARRKQLGGHDRCVGRAAIAIMLATSVTLLLATSLLALWQSGELGGWTLFSHTAAGGALIAVLPLTALLWLGAGARNPRPEGEVAPGWEPECSLASVLLGAVLMTGLLTAGSMLLGMLPLLSTDQMRRMLTVHAYSGLALGTFTVVYFGSLGLPGDRR